MSFDRNDSKEKILLIELNKKPSLKKKPAFLAQGKDFEGIETEKEILIEPL